MFSSCAYPTGYFDDPSDPSDGELESDRNTVRDVLRVLTCPMAGQDRPESVSRSVLRIIVWKCHSVVAESGQGEPPSEAVFHCLSALAKALNSLASSLAVGGGSPSPDLDVISTVLQTLQRMAELLGNALQRGGASAVFPQCRLFDMSLCSLSPFFASLYQGGVVAVELQREVDVTLRTVLPIVVRTVETIPEVMAPSILDKNPYDIVGAMRTPGGEDHVGVLVFSRLTNECSVLARNVVRATGGLSLLEELCRLHEDLLLIEQQRDGEECGRGVTPRTRRLLMKSISRFCTSLDGESVLGPTSQSLSAMLLLRVQLLDQTTGGAATLLNLACFPSLLLAELFKRNDNILPQNVKERVWEKLSNLGTNTNAQDIRSALAQLSLSSAAPSDFSDVLATLMVAWIKAECVEVQAGSHPSERGALIAGGDCQEKDWRSDGDEMPMCGETFIAIAAVIEDRASLVGVENACQILHQCCHDVMRVIVPDAGWRHSSFRIDSRAHLVEAFMDATRVMAMRRAQTDSALPVSGLVDDILSTTTCAAIFTMLQRTNPNGTGKKVTGGVDTTLTDSSHTLAILAFLDKSLSLNNLVRKACTELIQGDALRIPWVEHRTAEFVGLVVVVAGHLRAASSTFPPWALEGVALTLHQILSTQGAEPTFLLQQAMTIRLLQDSPALGLRASELLCGAFFEKADVSTNVSVLADSVGDHKKFKGVLKQVCGGKKKDSGFRQKPSSPRWRTTSKNLAGI